MTIPEKLSAEDIRLHTGLLHADWEVGETALTRKFAFKGFAKATQMANVVAYVSDQMKHHADIRFGWGYCHVIWTTHDAGGLTRLDFECAAKLDSVVG